MARLRAGDERAAWEVFQRYAGRLLARAHVQLDARLRHKVDPEDVVQSVYKSFFQRYAEGRFQLESWNSLWSLLVVITLRKCANQAQHHQRDCRAIDRERPPAPAGDSGLGWEAVDPEPTPEEVVTLTETLQNLLAELEPPERQIIELSLQGYTAGEIKEQLGRSERTVRRVRERFQHKLQRLRAEG
jgi:RNA polymerase sigma-70 factor (ECF subfamily)